MMAAPSARGWGFRRSSVIPGFGMALGFTLAYLVLIVLIPLSGLAWRSSTLGWNAFRVIAISSASQPNIDARPARFDSFAGSWTCQR